MQKLLQVISHKSGLSKTRLAEKLMASRKTLYNWLDGITEPQSRAHVELIKSLARKYKIKNIEGNSI